MATLSIVSRMPKSMQLTSSTVSYFSNGNFNRNKKRKDLPLGKKRRRMPFTRIALTRFAQDEEKPISEDPAHVMGMYSQPHPFDPYCINIPFRMGRPKPGETPPLAVTTPEILKIPNFLHLTPPTIHKQCEALKKLCTSWPESIPPLPLKLTTCNFVFPSHDIRHPESRIVKLKVVTVRSDDAAYPCRIIAQLINGCVFMGGANDVSFSSNLIGLQLNYVQLVTLSDLSLTDHARQKMVNLAGKRYDKATDTITIVGKKCPTRNQNKEYVMYLLKVLYLESNKVEPWEQTNG